MQTSEREKIIQNLKACDCDEEFISGFISSLESGRVKEALRLLDVHRQGLLDQFHKCNDRIGCPDYLVHQIENKNIGGTAR